MGQFLYIEHIQTPEIRFRILSYDEETGMGQLQSSLGVVFERKITREELEKRNYILKSSDVELDNADWPATAPLSIGNQVNDRLLATATNDEDE